MSRNIDLAELQNGTLMLVTDKRLPATPSTLEYYKNQQLMVITYKDSNQMDELLEYELPKDASLKVVKENSILVVAYDNDDGQEPNEFTVPIVHIES